MITWAGGLFWSYSDPGWLGLFAYQTSGIVLLRHEMTFYKTVPEDAAEEIVAFLRQRRITLSYTVAQPTLFPPPSGRRRGETIAETFARSGVPLRRGHDDPASGFSRMRSWLAPRLRADGVKRPSLMVHRDCQEWIRTVTSLIEDPKDKNLIDPTPDMYPTLATTFYLMSRPLPPRVPEEKMPDDAIGHEVQKIRDAIARGV